MEHLLERVELNKSAILLHPPEGAVTSTKSYKHYPLKTYLNVNALNTKIAN